MGELETNEVEEELLLSEEQPDERRQSAKLSVQCDWLVELLYCHHVAYGSTDKAELVEIRKKLLRIENMADREFAITPSESPDGRLLSWIAKLRFGNHNRHVSRDDLNDEKEHHLEKLKDIWTDPEFPEMMHIIMSHISPKKSLKFITSLCVRISADEFGQQKCYRDARQPVQLLFKKYEERDRVHNAPIELPYRPSKLNWFRDQFMSEVAIFYTEVTSMFGKDFADDSLDLGYINFTQALTRGSDKYDDHYATPIGQAIAARNWELAFPQFLWQRCMDLCFQFSLSWYLAPISQATWDEDGGDQSRLKWPTRWQLVAIAFFGLRGSVHLLIELIACLAWSCKQYPTRDSIPASYANSYTLLVLGIEIFSAFYVIAITYQHWTPPPSSSVGSHTHTDPMASFFADPGLVHSDDAKNKILYDHPGVLALLIFLKWVQMMLSVMSLNVLLPKLLPAWTAISSPESVVFLLFLVILSCGTMLSYFALPTDLDGPSDYFTALYRMFCLVFFADFEDNELEGVRTIMNKMDEDKYEDIEIYNDKVHLSMKGFTMLYSLLFPVIIINTYIGVLSDVYQKCLQKKIHVSGLYMSHVTCRLLLYRHFWISVARMTRCAFLSLDWWRACCLDGGTREEGAGVFIVIPVDYLPKEEVHDELTQRFTRMEKALGRLEDKIFERDGANSTYLRSSSMTVNT